MDATPTMPPRDPQPELDLLKRLRQGDEQAFVQVYRRHRDAVYRFALLRTGSAASAADVTQETFLQLITRPGRYDPARGSLAAWLCGVARNLARRAFDDREQATDPAELVEDGEAAGALAETRTPMDRLLADETAEQVRAALADVAPHYREVVILCEISELSYAEVAQVCGIDIGTVRSRLSRGRGQLAEQLERRGLKDGPAELKEAS